MRNESNAAALRTAGLGVIERMYPVEIYIRLGGSMMRPRRISDATAFEPEVLRLVQSAFDQAWQRLADKLPASEHAQSREHLAQVVMSVARQNSTNPAMLRDAALRLMEMEYLSRFRSARSGQSGTDG